MFRTKWGVLCFCWSNKYDLNGNCMCMVTPKGYEKEQGYDALDCVVTEKEQDKAVRNLLEFPI